MPDLSVISKYAPDASVKEWRFLTQCIAMQLAGEPENAASTLDAQGLDWSLVVRLAERNRVVPLLSSAVLANKVKNTSPRVAIDARDRFRPCAQRGMALAMELRSLLGSLTRAGIRCIPLKGPVLTISSYRKMGMRDFDDLDLFVAPEDVPGAVAVLTELGYTGWDISQPRIADHLSSESEHNLICKDRSVTVDLHWAIGRRYFTMPMDFDTLWARTARTKVIGAALPDLCAEDAVLFLCYHGGKHLFGRLSWICDVAATIAAHPGLDWDVLLARATEMGARRLLLLGLSVAHEVLGSELPRRVVLLIESEPRLRWLATRVLQEMFGGEDSRSFLQQQINASIFHLQVRERLSDRLRYLLWAAQPNARDWQDSRLPRSLGFLLVLSRPIRLLRKAS